MTTHADLHHADGTHRTTPTSASGHTLALYERAIYRHTEDGHSHEVKNEQRP